MKTQVFILAAGKSSRWRKQDTEPKQLSRVNDETLLDRTIRLVKEQNLDDVCIVAHDVRLKTQRAEFFEPRQSECVVESLLSTRELWGQRNIVLLGDVFYTERAMQTIVGYENPIAVFGRRMPSQFTNAPWPEIFALCFNRTQYRQLLEGSEYALQHGNKESEIKLWQVYRAVARFPLFPMEAHRFEKKIFRSINDFTEDFDTPEEYDRFIYRYDLATCPNPVRRWAFWLRAYTLTSLLSPLYKMKHLLVRILIACGLWTKVKMFLSTQRP